MGGSLRNPSWHAHERISLTANGGTIDTAVAGERSNFREPVTLAPGATSATFTKAGPGGLGLEGDSAFTTLNVNAGAFSAGRNDLAFGVANGTVNVADGASVGASSVTSPSTRTFVLAGNATFVGSSWAVNSSITGPGNLTIGLPNDIGSRVGLAGVNSYAGATYINDGTLSVSGGNAIPDGSAVIMGHASAMLDVLAHETIGLAGGPRADPHSGFLTDANRRGRQHVDGVHRQLPLRPGHVP